MTTIINEERAKRIIAIAGGKYLGMQFGNYAFSDDLFGTFICIKPVDLSVESVIALIRERCEKFNEQQFIHALYVKHCEKKKKRERIACEIGNQMELCLK